MANDASTHTDSPKRKKRRLLQRVLTGIEVVGNKLPHPATLFALLAVVVVLLSWLLANG